MSFFGAVVRPGKAVPYMPPPEPMRLHLSQVALGDGTKGRVTLRVRVSGGDPEEEDEQPELGDEIIIAVLEHGKAESQTLDLVFDTYAEFTATGGEVHVSGYYVPEYDEEDVDDDDDEEDDYLDPEMMDEEELAEMYGLGSDSDEDEEDGEERRLIPASRVKIEEIDADGKPVQPGGGAKGGAGEDDSDDDEDEDDEDMDDDDDDEEEEEDAKPKGGKGSKGDGKGGAKGNAKGDGNGGAKGDGKASGGQDKKRRAEEGEQGATPGGKKAKADGKDSKGAHGHSHDHGHGHGHDHSHCDHGHGHSHGHDHKGDKEGGQGSSDARQQDLTKAGMVKEYENGFKIEQLGVGKAGGAVAKAGKQVVMKYVGKLAANGRVFDQSKSFKFRLGVGEVIKGWDRGIVGMRVGDRRRLTIPPQMAYGPKGVKGSIPPNATLVFEVELVSVK